MTSRFISRAEAALQLARSRVARHLPRGRDRSLRRKLSIGTGIVLVCTALLAVSLIGRSFGDYRRAGQNLRGLESYRLILDTANLLSAERGPSNSVLGDSGAATHNVLRERLTAFRARSDAILDQLSAKAGVPPDLLKSVRVQLLEAR